MKKVIKENKVLFILAIVIIISLILIVIKVVSFFYNTKTDPYGDRLDGIENYPISENISEDIKALYESGMEEVKVDVKGKIIYVTFDVSGGTSKVDARSMALKSLDVFSDEIKGFYDIHYTLTCKNCEENTIYPMMGSKHKGESQVVWTNN